MEILRKVGILLVLLTFMMSTFNKISNPLKTLEGIEKKGLPFPILALGFAILSQVVGITTILTSEFKLIEKQYQKYGKISLIIFTILATYFYHNIFTMENQTINFMKNMGLIGGLILI